MFLRNFR
ncbi:hypothetical protein A2U01_0088172, partial [Trifolium medium]|nr:hypothetical protein [Trifolium medium]